jgi:hypothetical protein
MSTVLMAAIALFAALMLLSPAQAFEAKLSGQVNQLIMWADNGNDSDFFIADNDNSSTRFRFTGTEAFDWGKIGFLIELEAQRNASNTLDIPNTGDGDFEFNDRWLDAYFETGFGKISLGKGSGAADNTAEVDLSGTAVITYAGVNDTAGGFTWKAADGTDFRPGLTVGDTRSDFDGLGRNERVRYDTPMFAGFNFAGSITNGNAWELAGFYASEFPFGKLAAAAGYVDSRDRDTIRYKQWDGSVSWLAPFGLNLTFSAGQRDPQAGGGSKADNFYSKVGYKFGIHAVSAELGITKDLNAAGDESSNWGAGYVITPWNGVELYAALRRYRLETSAEPDDPDDISQVMAGTRIKF